MPAAVLTDPLPLPPLPQARPGENRQKNRVKQRGREGLNGLAVGSRQQKTGEGGGGASGPKGFTKVRVKCVGLKTIEKASKAAGGAGGGAAGDKSKNKKRSAKDLEEEAKNAKRPSKQAKGSGSGGGGGGSSQPMEDDFDVTQGIHQVRYASDRSEEQRVKHEVNQVIEVAQPGPPDQQEWKLAIVRGVNEQGLYTVQYEPVAENRHKQTGVEWQNTRWACSHPDCKTHNLALAALPLFCDRCRKALMQAPQQRVYHQESQDAAERAGASSCIRLCNTCYSSLRAELKSGGQQALLAETQKFTRDHPGGERSVALQLNGFDELPVPQRDERSSGPIMGSEIDARWAQCEVCHRWQHWTCAMYDDTQFTGGRNYYCTNCKHLEPPSEQATEAALNNDAENLTQIPMSEFIEKVPLPTPPASRPPTIPRLSCCPASPHAK